jgi:hypothetical protein
MTAGQALTRIRELAQMFTTTHEDFRDGFTADAAETEKTPILPSLNEYLAELGWLKYRYKNNTIPLVADDKDYDIWAQAWTDFYEIEWVYWNGEPLKRTNREALEATSSGWQSLAAGIPQEYFIEGNEVVVVPKPSAAAIVTDSTLDCRCVSTHPILDDAADEILYIPHALQLLLPYGATANLLNIEVDNPDHQKRYAHIIGKMQIFEDRMQRLGTPQTKSARVSFDRKIHALPFGNNVDRGTRQLAREG